MEAPGTATANAHFAAIAASLKCVASQMREKPMSLLRLVAISLLALVGLAQSSAAQSGDSVRPEQLPKFIEETRIDEIREEPSQIVVGLSRMPTHGRIAPDLLIVCERTKPNNKYEILIVKDRMLETRIFTPRSLAPATRCSQMRANAKTLRSGDCRMTQVPRGGILRIKHELRITMI
jgi:hypothetical protein